MNALGTPPSSMLGRRSL
ncbi:hypothetical protein E2C01_073375 [Portunus trituberculatus]|uniref:Uncharacterized protein n=1 Tax=Portunus trituberculatus TaxID=210409 RepID=A0A5B7I9A0_PORTR|nr:hypothetical protein [Portunus trituberculatus]